MRTDAPSSPVRSIGAANRVARWIETDVLPVASILAVLIFVWYVAAIWLNADLAKTRLEQAEPELDYRASSSTTTWSLDRPLLPAPASGGARTHQHRLRARRRPRAAASSITATSRARRPCVGFALGTLLGILLAIGIVHLRTLERSFLPWVIASQTVPILAIAPMIIVVSAVSA